MSKSLRLPLLGAILLPILYVVTYVSLSVNGRYEATVHGAEGVKLSSWYPAGFFRDKTNWEYNLAVVYSFYPLWQLDRSYWHGDISGPPPGEI